MPACLHTRGGGVEAGKQSYNMQEADECCLPIYLPLDASLPHCSLMLSSARAFFAHWKYEQRCKIFQNCAHTLFSTLKLQSASLDLHPCLQFRCLLAGLALWGGRRKGKPRSSRQLAGEWHNLPPLRWSQPAGGKGGTAADETERGMDKCDQKQVCKCSTISSSLSQARDNDGQVGEMPIVRSAEFGPIREISDVGESCRRHISNLRP